jgi:hypothetical protein
VTNSIQSSFTQSKHFLARISVTRSNNQSQSDPTHCATVDPSRWVCYMPFRFSLFVLFMQECFFFSLDGSTAIKMLFTRRLLEQNNRTDRLTYDMSIPSILTIPFSCQLRVRHMRSNSSSDPWTVISFSVSSTFVMSLTEISSTRSPDCQ